MAATGTKSVRGTACFYTSWRAGGCLVDCGGPHAIPTGAPAASRLTRASASMVHGSATGFFRAPLHEPISMTAPAVNANRSKFVQGNDQMKCAHISRSSSVAVVALLTLCCGVLLLVGCASKRPAAQTTSLWAVGTNGAIFHSSDGTTWTSQNSHTRKDLNAVWFVDERVGWAVGYSGAILHTSDGGVTWYAQHSVVSHTLYGVCAIDADHAFAVGGEYPRHGGLFEGVCGSGVIVATADGGTSWRVVFREKGAVLQAVVYEGNRLWAVGGHELVRSDDGGRHWDVVANAGLSRRLTLSGELSSVAVSGDGLVWAGTSGRASFGAEFGGAILSSDDEGAGWKRPPGVEGMEVAASGSAVWTLETNEVYVSRDGGATWAGHQIGAIGYVPGAYYLVGLAEAGASRAWAVGTLLAGPTTGFVQVVGDEYPSGGVILGSTDGGITWHREATVRNTFFAGVACVGS